MNKQTAVEFLLGHMWTTDWTNYTREEKLKVIEQAKEMEKQQIVYAYIVADSESAQQSEQHALNYYDRTYGK